MVNSNGYPNAGTGIGQVSNGQVNFLCEKGLATRGEFCPVPNTQTLTGNLTIVQGDKWLQQITPGAARNVTMPATSLVWLYLIVNRASTASHIITVKDSAASTVGTIGPGASAIVASDGTTVTISRLDAGTTGFTDNSGGTASTTIAAGVGISTLVFYVEAASLANGDVMTEYVPGYAFKILAFDARCAKVVSTGAKAATLNLEIETTNVTGGAIALAGTYAIGAVQAGTAVTAANTGTAAQKLSIEAASVTAFVEGAFWLIVSIQNMDTVNAIASLAARS